MARTRSENYDGIHLGILTNAARLFSAQGYMRASIADLADACKLSRGALYHYFDSKEAILFAILDAHIREMIEHVETAVAAGGPTLTQFQNVIRAIVEVNAKSPHEQRVLIHDLSFLNEDEQQAIKDLERQLVDIVTDLLVRLDAERQDRQAHQEDLHDDPVRHHQLHLHLVRSQGRDRSAGIRRHGGRIVFARVCARRCVESCRSAPAREGLTTAHMLAIRPNCDAVA